MKQILLSLFFLNVFAVTYAQNFTGQWKGKFLEKSTSFMGWGGDECDYVLELEVKGKTVTGYSYTYFNDGGKRYYTICKLTGFTNKASKYIEVREIERTKTNVPRHISNCFQIHKLTFFKQGNEETLEGSWIPAPNQDGDCGSGTTTLTRRVLQTKTPAFNNATTRVTKPKQPPNIVVNELIMYAENLGSIPPNTAIMVVTDGGNRYEVRIASDLKKKRYYSVYPQTTYRAIIHILLRY
ncbi:MAG: hypothetical protein IPP48_14370 [Chitinophagaceae bacterium]|nr:hypothetical protein [Chitinophagaceae bacterium]